MLTVIDGDTPMMDRALASWISFGAFTWYMKVHETTDWARTVMNDEQHRLYCRAAGRVLGYTIHDLLDPIYNIYPELTPAVLRSDGDTDPDTTLSSPAQPKAPVASYADMRRRVLQLADSVELNLRDIASMARLYCKADEASSLQKRVDDVLEQVENWRQFFAP